MGGIVAVPTFSEGARCTTPQPEWFVNQGYSLPLAKDRRTRSAIPRPVGQKVEQERQVRTSHNTPLQSPTTYEQQAKKDPRINEWIANSIESTMGDKSLPLQQIQNHEKFKIATKTKARTAEGHRRPVRHVARAIESSAG